eukprot:1181233-Prorocentrum_minimum.AAC.2
MGDPGSLSARLGCGELEGQTKVHTCEKCIVVPDEGILPEVEKRRSYLRTNTRAERCEKSGKKPYFPRFYDLGFVSAYRMYACESGRLRTSYNAVKSNPTTSTRTNFNIEIFIAGGPTKP